MMRSPAKFLRFLGACSLAFLAVVQAFADAPATEYFVVDSAKLAALAPDDTQLETVSSDQLRKISVVQGSYTGDLSMRATSTRFRIDARFTAAFSEATESIRYNISASTSAETWDVCSEQGAATRTGTQFVTERWRTRPLAVVLRFLNLKH